MRIQHDRDKVTAFGHQNYIPYSVYEGKLASRSPDGHVHTCVECGKRFATKMERTNHRCRPAVAS